MGHYQRLGPWFPAESPWAMRNKMQFSFGGNNNGLHIGLYAPRSHRVVNADYCHIMTPKMNAVLDAVRVWHDASNWSVFNEASGTGILRHLTIRYAHQTGQLMVILTISALMDMSSFIEHMIAVDGMKSVYVCIQPDPSIDQVLSDDITTAFGD